MAVAISPFKEVLLLQLVTTVQVLAAALKAAAAIPSAAVLLLQSVAAWVQALAAVI